MSSNFNSLDKNQVVTINLAELKTFITDTIRKAAQEEKRQSMIFLMDEVRKQNQEFRQDFHESEKLKKELVNQKESKLDIKGLAEKFSVKKATIHNWMKRGWIEGKKVGKQRFFYQRDIDGLIRMSGNNLRA